jgi:hypothetical protein
MIKSIHPRGAVAQLGERIVRNDEAVGSIPTSSTNLSITYGKPATQVLSQSVSKNPLAAGLAESRRRDEVLIAKL